MRWLQRLSSKQKILLSLVSLFFLSTTGSYAFFNYLQPGSAGVGLDLVTPTPVSIPSKTPEELKNLDTLTVLLVGFGGPGHAGGYLTDSNLLAHFDFPRQTVSFISIPRDLMVNVNGSTKKINSLMTANMGSSGVTGAFPALQAKVSEISGLSVDYVIGIDFVGFMRLIGEDLGGIDVKVEETLSDPWYPVRGREVDPCGHTPEEIAQMTATMSGFQLEKQFPCRYEHIHYEPGIVTMQGSDALAFVRSRHSSSDFSRSHRQMAVLAGIRDRLFTLNALENLPNIINTIKENVYTNLDTDIIEHLTPALKNVGTFKVNRITLSTDNVLSPGSNAALIPQDGLDQYTTLHSYIQSNLEKK